MVVLNIQVFERGREFGNVVLKFSTNKKVNERGREGREWFVVHLSERKAGKRGRKRGNDRIKIESKSELEECGRKGAERLVK